MNRDLSIAVLRAFAAKRQQEHESLLTKKVASYGNRKESSRQNERCNGDLETENPSTISPSETNNLEHLSSEHEALPPEEDLSLETVAEDVETSGVQITKESPITAVVNDPLLENPEAKPLHVLEVCYCTALFLSHQLLDVIFSSVLGYKYRGLRLDVLKMNLVP